MKIFELHSDTRKSFYGKCKVIEDEDVATLYSYDTKIMSYNLNTKEVETFAAYNISPTTKRHQEAFVKFYNIGKEK